MYGKLLNYKLSGDTAHIIFENGSLFLQAFTENILRICSDPHRISDAVTAQPAGVKLSVISSDDCLIITSGHVKARVYDHGYIDIYDSADHLVCSDYRGERNIPVPMTQAEIDFMMAEGHCPDFSEYEDQQIQVIKTLEPDDHFYGLGDKTGFLDKRGYGYVNWNTDNPHPHVDSFRSLYKSIPFFQVLRKNCCYGIFYDNPFRSLFDFGKQSEAYYWFGSNDGSLDYYYIAGASLKEILTHYADLTGHAPLPQLWTLGFHQSKWSYLSQSDVLSVAENMRKHQLPCDVIHLDIDYMDGFRVFTWNPEHFSDPEMLVKKLKDMGIKVVTIIDPGVKKDEQYRVYQEGLEKDYFAKTPAGAVYENVVWPGTSVFPDFTNPEVRSWWGKWIKTMTDRGVRGIWNDMNEPASFAGELPEDVQFLRGSHKEVHNLYGHYMAQATYEGLKKADGRRPFVITRACYSGSQKYAIGWTGDNHSLWSHLAMGLVQICNLGLSGMPIVGTDVGGFGSDATPELYARWIQLGAFSPFFRVHSCKGTRPQEPYAFNDEITEICRKYIGLRYRLMPYLYDLFRDQTETGLPVFRPLVLEHQEDKNVLTINDEFLLGSQILVAPVTMQGQTRRMVYLPEGTWYDYWTKEKLEGGQWIIREAPLDICPLYVKAGTILPICDQPILSTDELPADTLTLELYPGEGELLHYEDDRETFAYQQGAYRVTLFTQSADGELHREILHDQFAGADKIYIIHIQ